MSRRIEFEKLLNTRDLGGMRTTDGHRIRPGKLIRSGHLVAASEKDQQKISELAEVIVDFRSDRECAEREEPMIPGTRYIRLPILEERKAGVTRDKESYEEVRQTMLSDAEIARAYMMRTYGGFVTSEYSRGQYERFVRLLTEDRGKAVLWHCTAGKDRAGFGTVIVQEILGVSREDIFADYLMTNVCLEPEIQGIIGHIREKTGFMSPEMEKGLRYMFAAWQEYLEAAYDTAAENYGDFRGYIQNGLHITEEEQQILRTIYLE